MSVVKSLRLNPHKERDRYILHAIEEAEEQGLNLREFIYQLISGVQHHETSTVSSEDLLQRLEALAERLESRFQTLETTGDAGAASTGEAQEWETSLFDGLGL
jgi:hypothetical protein